MFKEFWEKKKGPIECTAFLVATGALFLNIPLPEMEVARASLLKVQLMWLFLVTLSVAILAWHFLFFVLEVERQIKGRFSLNPRNALSTFFLALFLYLIWNLWKYMINLYEAEWKWFSVSVLFFLYVGYFSLFAHLVFLLEKKVNQTRTFVLYSLGMSMLFAIIPTLYYSLSTLKWSLGESYRSFIVWTSANALVLSIFLIHRHFRKPTTQPI